MGLVQHEIEKAGLTTITLSAIPEFTASASVPRIAAIEYPSGRTLGMPVDVDGQMAVLRAVFQALETIKTPGSVIHLPFEWPESRREVLAAQKGESPPITQFLMKKPTYLPKFIKRDIPAAYKV